MISSKSFFCSKAAARARSVFPVPAFPVSATRLMSGESRASKANSCSGFLAFIPKTG